MKCFKPISSLVVMSLLTLLGCTNPEQATIPTTVNPNLASAPEKPASGNNSLLTIVSKTKTAVISDNFGQAQQEFDKFEGAWKEVEDGVKAKSHQNYDVIETNLDNLTQELKATKPQKAKVMTALQSLEKTITVISQS
jgi:hypothetical protein